MLAIKLTAQNAGFIMPGYAAKPVSCNFPSFQAIEVG
jgi:hypothetical protein